MQASPPFISAQAGIQAQRAVSENTASRLRGDERMESLPVPVISETRAKDNASQGRAAG